HAAKGGHRCRVNVNIDQARHEEQARAGNLLIDVACIAARPGMENMLAGESKVGAAMIAVPLLVGVPAYDPVDIAIADGAHGYDDLRAGEFAGRIAQASGGMLAWMAVPAENMPVAKAAAPPMRRVAFTWMPFA